MQVSMAECGIHLQSNIPENAGPECSHNHPEKRCQDLGPENENADT